MSSSLPTRRFTWSLRTRLIAAVVALLAVVCLVVGVVTQVAVYRIEMGQLDQRVRTSAQQVAHQGDERGGPDEPLGGLEPLRGGRPGPPPGTVDARVVGGTVTVARVFNDAGGAARLPESAQTVLAQLPVDGHAYTRTLRGHDYRLMAV